MVFFFILIICFSEFSTLCLNKRALSKTPAEAPSLKERIETEQCYEE
jgi:hypothetical protein